ncbi:hypothetical protein CMT41_12410 [Colwellia sp. MT41]|nr:hypothetical protein CMT41_12410 [Colwellia sp. MT41]
MSKEIINWLNLHRASIRNQHKKNGKVKHVAISYCHSMVSYLQENKLTTDNIAAEIFVFNEVNSVRQILFNTRAVNKIP